MKKKTIVILICFLFITASVLPAMGKINNEKNFLEEKNIFKKDKGITRFWNPEHTAAIWIDKIYVYDDSDPPPKGDGEFFFKMLAIPSFWKRTTDPYEVNDENPEIPYNLGKLGAFKTKFTPQWIFILAMEDDVSPDLSDDFLDWKIFKLKPPKGDYPSDDPYMEIFNWENDYFKAVVKIYFSYYDEP